jgi:hypothetical protein
MSNMETTSSWALLALLILIWVHREIVVWMMGLITVVM